MTGVWQLSESQDSVLLCIALELSIVDSFDTTESKQKSYFLFWEETCHWWHSVLKTKIKAHNVLGLFFKEDIFTYCLQYAKDF